MYPTVRGETITTSFKFIFDPCPFESLKLLSGNKPVSGQMVTALLAPSMAFNYNLEDSVERSSGNECGQLAIDFTIDGQELP